MRVWVGPDLATPGSQGVTPAAALAFMRSAPAINPVVLGSTAVAFPGRPNVVVARLVASALTAFVVGLTWSRFGDVEAIVRRAEERTVVGASRLETFVAASFSQLSLTSRLAYLVAVPVVVRIVVAPSPLGAVAATQPAASPDRQHGQGRQVPAASPRFATGPSTCPSPRPCSGPRRRSPAGSMTNRCA